MKNLGIFLSLIGLGLIGTLVGGYAILMVARFGDFPLSYRAAMAVSLFITYVSIRRNKFNDDEGFDLPKAFLGWVKEMLSTGVFMLIVLLFGWFLRR